MPIINQVGSVKIKNIFSCIFVFFVVQNFKTQKSRMSITSQVGSVRIKKKEFFVCFRVFRGSKFKDTKGTNAYNKSSRIYKNKKYFFVCFRVFRGL